MFIYQYSNDYFIRSIQEKTEKKSILLQKGDLLNKLLKNKKKKVNVKSHNRQNIKQYQLKQQDLLQSILYFIIELERAIIQLQNKCNDEQIYDHSQQYITYQYKEVDFSQNDRIISQIVYCVIQILKDNLEQESYENDIWDYISQILTGRYSLEFMKQKCSYISQSQQKLQIWILLELSYKSLDNTQFIHLYKIESCIRDRFLKLIELCKVLQRIGYKINGNLPSVYDQFCKEQENKEQSTPFHSKQLNKSHNIAKKYTLNVQSQRSQENRLKNYTIMPSIADISPKLNHVNGNTNTNAETPIAAESLKLNMTTSITMNFSPISKVVEESEDDRTGRYQQNAQQNNESHFYLQSLLGQKYGNNKNQSVHLIEEGRGTFALADTQTQSVEENQKKDIYKIRPSHRLLNMKYENISEKFQDKYSQANTDLNQLYDPNVFTNVNSYFNFIFLQNNIKNNAYFCYYTGQWYCYDCIAVNKKPIPWKAIESFDLANYKVCKKAEKEINQLYSKPIIKFEYDSELVIRSQILQYFMILKRQIHLFYDFICNPQYVEDLLNNCLNILIKPNIFSLKNFYDINNGSLTKQVEEAYKIFLQHTEKCDICSKKGIECYLCNKGPKVFLFDIKNTSLCDKCNSIYHKNCLQVKECEKCLYSN